MIGTFEQLDMESAIESVRYANSMGTASDRDLYHVLLCTENPEYHEEALEIARKNIDTEWGRQSLFKLCYNGVGTERDVKTALYVLLSDNPLVRRKNSAEI